MIKISNAELEVLKVIWQLKEATSLEIIKHLQHCNWNANTIRTLINRLITKKAIGISKREGKTYTYVPLIDEKLYKQKRAKQFIDQFHNGSVRDMLLTFVESGDLSRDELEKMMELFDKR